MVKHKEEAYQSREEAAWMVMQLISERQQFNKSNHVTLKFATHLKSFDEDDARSIMRELEKNQAVIIETPKSPSLYIVDKDKSAHAEQKYQEQLKKEIRVIVTDKFNEIYKELQRQFSLSSKQQLSLQLTAAKKHIASYQKIMLAMAVDHYGFDRHNPLANSSAPQNIRAAMTRAGLPTVSKKIIKEKLIAAATDEALDEEDIN